MGSWMKEIFSRVELHVAICGSILVCGKVGQIERPESVHEKEFGIFAFDKERCDLIPNIFRTNQPNRSD